MRHVSLSDLLQKMLKDIDTAKSRARLAGGHTKVTKMLPGLRQGYIRRNGPKKWSPVKEWLTNNLGKKCWYTEAELVGTSLTIDHYRPVSKYWWLAFAMENYRVACAFANSPQYNALQGRVGGKGDAFPLLPPGRQATWRLQTRRERPVLLDPCDKNDCDLISFQPDGRPVINPIRSTDTIASERLQESMILLNLDHPDFNTKREQLCRNIAGEVLTIEALAIGSLARTFNIDRLAERLGERAPFSSAARHYLQFHRHLLWVEDLLIRVK